MKKRVIRSAIPIYLCALSWIVYGMFLPLYRIGDILLCAGISIIVKLLASRLFPGRVVEEEEKPNSGDEAVNQQIMEGRANLKSLKDSAEALQEPRITAHLERMIAAGDKIFKALEKNPRDSQQIRKFMNYYLPTSVKLLDSYRTLSAAGAGENVQKSLTSIENSLSMIVGAFEKQLDRLYADDQLDINAEISALESMMAADGLTEGSIARQEK